MNVYHIDEATLILPSQAQDQSVTIFAFYSPDTTALPPVNPQETPPEFSVVISRDPAEPSETIDGFVNRQLKILQQSLPGFALLQRGALLIDGADSVTTEYTWRSDNRLMYQRQVYAHCPPAAGNDASVVLTVTGTSLEGLQSRYETTFQQLIYSIKFRR